MVRAKANRSAVRRDGAEEYLLTSLVAFAATVILTREFLQLTGFPQIGNSVLHIAHALWGGLLLFAAVLFPLAFANRWALQASALLSGLGIGLFIDEVGKFITQANDYFFPPALSLVYAFFLLMVLVYLQFRRPPKKDPRKAMYHALEGFQDLLDGDLDAEEVDQIKTQLSVAMESEVDEIASMAKALNDSIQAREYPEAEPGIWRRISERIVRLGRGLGRNTHRTIISLILIVWVIIVVGFIAILALDVSTLDSQILQWRNPLLIIQAIVGVLMGAALILWLMREETRGLQFATYGFLLSLVALQTLYFYLSQFSALSATLVQVVFLQVLFAYRRWYINE
jgi:uncharacterized membrane protein YsdA (DUF1294 family)